MTKKYQCTPEGVCPQQISLSLTDGLIDALVFRGGCHGNGQAVAALLKGMPPEEAIGKLKGINCKGKGTSCADQVAQLLERILVQEKIGK